MLISSLIFFVILVLSIVIHELSHAVVADKLGDPTARLAGRITLNPIPHLDPIGSVLIPLMLILTHAGFLFGWAKPVPFDPYNLKNPRRDSALIALAGPTSNFLLAIIASLIGHLVDPSSFTYALMFSIISLNVTLAIFNLVPVSPLDGFKIVGGLLSAKQAQDWYSLERYGMIFLLILILPIFGSTSMVGTFISPIISFITGILLP